MKSFYDHHGMTEADAYDEGVERVEPGTVSCKFCGSRDVYWMTCMGRREAIITAKLNNNPRILQLAKAKLYNVAGGEHDCRSVADASEFD